MSASDLGDRRSHSLPIYLYSLSNEAQRERSEDTLPYLPSHDMTLFMFLSSSNMEIQRRFEDELRWQTVDWFERPQGLVLRQILKPGDTIVTMRSADIFKPEHAGKQFRELQDLGVRLHIVISYTSGNVLNQSFDDWASKEHSLPTQK